MGLLALLCLAGRALAQQTICAAAKIELGQEAALEREGFTATLSMTNNLADQSLSGLRIELIVKDANGQPAESLFFANVTSLEGTTAIDGTGNIQPSGSAKTRWLIIPTQGAGGTAPAGVRYTVQARMSMLTGGVPRVVTTFPVAITVKPQPLLTLEYVLPFEVFGDEPLTEVHESTIPFPLGLRVSNVGAGAAKNFRVQSNQPLITDNAQGLAVDFSLLGTWLGPNALPENTLLIPFGDIPAGGAKQAAWSMVSTLSGRFVNFTSTFTHAAELGGALTSLIQSVTTYTLVKDVIVDLPGRDAQFDFLVNVTTPRSQMEEDFRLGREPKPEYLMESDRPGLTPVHDVPAQLTGSLSGAGSVLHLSYLAPVSSNSWVHAAVSAPNSGSAPLVSVTRADGKVVSPRNAWISKHFDKDSRTYSYFLHVLDYTGESAQDFSMAFNAASLDTPPAAVADLTVTTAAPGALDLRWTATGEDGNTGAIFGGRYAVFATTSPLAVPVSTAALLSFSTNTAPGAAQAYRLSGLSGNATYYVAVFLADSLGQYSAASNVAAARTLAFGPQAVVLNSATETALAFSWSNAANLPGTAYRLTLSTAGGAVAQTGYLVDASTREFTGLAPNATHYLSAQARNADLLESPAAAVSTAVTRAFPPLALPFTETGTSSGTANWALGGNPEDTEFQAELSTQASRSPVFAASGWVRRSSFTFAGLPSGATYYGQVKARNHAGVETAYADLGALGVGTPEPTDTVPPVTTIAFSTPSFSAGGVVTAVSTRSLVSLFAVDPSSGSGVAATYYAVDAATPAIAYAAPFRLEAGTHTVFYRSVDAAGNAEAVSSATVAVYDAPFAGSVVPSSGPIGVSLSLTGFGFGAYGGANSRLLFNASTAPVSVWNDGLITATVPGVSTGSYALSVQVAGSTTPALVGGFDVLAPIILSVVPSSGPIGLQFTLTGQAFGPYNGANTQVLMGGTTVPISVWNDARIVGTVPGALAPGVYPVQVRRRAAGGGEILSNEASFQVSELVLAAVSPSTGPIGVPFSLSGYGFGPYNGANTQVLFGGTTAAISAWNDTGIQGTIPALSTGAYSVTVQRVQGSGIALSNVATFTVTALTLAAPTPSSGPIAVAFTLAGSGFGGYNGANTRVLMGGATVAVSVWNDTTISGTVPSLSTGTQPLWIERRSGGGLQASNTVYFEVVAPAVAAVFPSSGPIGTVFTLSGAGFGTFNGVNTQVLVAGTTAPVSVWNDSTITATVPGTVAVGTAAVVVRRAGADGGTSLSEPVSFLVVSQTASGLSPSSGPIGVPFTLDGAGFGAYNGANTRLLFGETAAAVSVWNDARIQGTIPALSTGAWPVVVERVQGAGSTRTDVATFTVTELALSTPTPAGGPVGTVFTLSGAGYGPYSGANTRLLIAGTTAAVSVWNDTTITGTAPSLPPGPQPVWLERVSGTGLQASNTVYFQIVAPAIASVAPSSGPIGVAFTLTGSGFGTFNGANTQVLIGGTTAPISVWNDTTITGTVPGALALTPGEATVVVRRIAAGGVSFSTAAAFLVLTPAVATVSPSTAPIGLAFTLTGAGFGSYNGANTRLLFGETAAPVSVWNDTTIKGTVPALSTGVYALAVERLQGGYSSRSSTAAFTVTAGQVYAMTPSSAPIGAPFTITGTSFGAYNGANTRVKFNGVAAPISVWSDSTITGTVPGAVSSGPAVVVIERAVGASVASYAAPDFQVLVPTISTMTPGFGLAGTAVTLNGFGFGPYAGASGTQLLVNGSTMPVAVWNDGMIRWTVPASLPNGTYPVVVRRSPAGGSVESSSATFTVGTGMGTSALFASGPATLATRPDWHFEGGLNLPADEGGLILTPSQAAVTVPPGALEADTEITIRRERSQYQTARADALSQARLGAAGEPVSFGPEGTQFTTPVTIELPYDPTLVPAGMTSQLAIHYFDPALKAWTPLQTQVDSARHVLVARTSHFSLYQPLGPGIGVQAADAGFGFKDHYAFPNPVRGQGFVTIRVQPGLADSITVRVYDVSGRKVHESSDFRNLGAFDDGNGKGAQFTWDHTWDVSGVGSGVYIYAVTAKKAGERDIVKRGRVGVIK